MKENHRHVTRGGGGARKMHGKAKSDHQKRRMSSTFLIRERVAVVSRRTVVGVLQLVMGQTVTEENRNCNSAPTI